LYLAELHGKLSSKNENREDILTSNVFSFFKYSDRVKFLKPFFKSIGIVVSEKEAKKAEFSFWPIYAEGTEPDLVIMTDTFYILIEAKYFSDFAGPTKKTKAQLVREVEMGSAKAEQLKKHFFIIAITSDYFCKEDKFKEIPSIFEKNFKWTNWQNVTEILMNMLNNNFVLNSSEMLFTSDLYNLLIKKKLRRYQVIKLTSQRLKPVMGIFYDVFKAKYRDKFIGFQNALCFTKNLQRADIKHLFYFNNKFESFHKLKKLKYIANPIFYKG